MNDVTLVGRLTRAPELRQASADRMVANFAVAVDRDYKDASGNRPTDFWDIQAWGKLGELVAQYTDKGCRVLVQGRYQDRPYTAKDGAERHGHEIVASTVKFIDFKNTDNAPAPSDDLPDLPDDLPF